MVRVEISDAALETGALLVDMLKRKGIYDADADAAVCYGISSSKQESLTLNGKCMSNKIKRMVAMAAAGVRLVPWFTAKKYGAAISLDTVQFPLLARKITGHGGTDIVPVFEPKEVAWRIAAGWDWFSSYIPTRTEYRVWVYRGDCLDIYEKVMKRPSDYKYVGRNFRNGFDFEPCVVRHKDAIAQATIAIHALGLDFGAVDMLRGEDGIVYVLEVNTAPGVIKSGAQKTLRKLVDRIVAWDESGHKQWDCCR